MAKSIRQKSRTRPLPINPQPPRLEDLVGKTVLIGITRLDHKDELIEQKQMAGTFESMDSTIHIRLLGSGEDFTLPPDLNSFLKAAPGIYRLRSTGLSVENPAYTSSWTIRAPAPNGKKTAKLKSKRSTAK